MYSPMESFMCTKNGTSGHNAAMFSRKKTLIITKYHVCWLNWMDATPFRLCGPSNNGLFQHVDKGQELFRASRLHLVSFECFNF